MRKNSQRGTSGICCVLVFRRSHVKLKPLTRFSVTVEDSSHHLHTRDVRGALPSSRSQRRRHPASLSPDLSLSLLRCHTRTHTREHARKPQPEPRSFSEALTRFGGEELPRLSLLRGIKMFTLRCSGPLLLFLVFKLKSK